MSKLRVLDIVRGTTVDGEGFRTAIYFAGCRHACPGCHNPQSWDFNAGTEMTVDELMAVVEEEEFDVTLTGGDPFYSAEEILPLARRIRERGLTVWAYTGFTLEEILADPKLSLLLDEVDVLVDGPYVEALRDPDLPFRGSSNQRIHRIRNEES